MSEDVKPTRRYDSPRRREQAAATRRAILDAAQRLFQQQGYAQTSMAAIASEAGVALKTVYLVFGTKSQLFLALWHLLLRGDEADEPVGERSWYRQVLDEPDPEQKLRRAARASRLVKERAGGLLEVLRAAAPTEPELDGLWQRIQSEFHANQRAIVESLAALGALKPGLDVDTAADVMWTVNSPAVYHLLVGERGWSGDRFEQWLGDTFCELLLA